jgi:hypothetical protein
MFGHADAVVVFGLQIERGHGRARLQDLRNANKGGATKSGLPDLVI